MAETSVVSTGDRVIGIGNMTFLMEGKARFQPQVESVQVWEPCFEGSSRNSMRQQQGQEVRRVGACGAGVGLTCPTAGEQALGSQCGVRI